MVEHIPAWEKAKRDAELEAKKKSKPKIKLPKLGKRK